MSPRKKIKKHRRISAERYLDEIDARLVSEALKKDKKRKVNYVV